MTFRDGGRSPSALTGRDQRLRDYLAALDAGEIVTGRILQILDVETVRVALGPGVLCARALGGRPSVGPCRLEVVAPGPRPVLRVVAAGGGDAMEIRIDVSHEKRSRWLGERLDRRI